MRPAVWSDSAARRSDPQSFHQNAPDCLGLALSCSGGIDRAADGLATASHCDPQVVKNCKSEGFSLIGFLCTLIVLGCVVLSLIRLGPSVFEYWAIEKAVKAASAMSGTPAELRAAYDKLASVGYVDAVQGKDLVIKGSGDSMIVSFNYEKRIHLAGPASLLIVYRGTTASDASSKSEN